MNKPPIINARFMVQQLTGVQRFAREISKELVKINPRIYLAAPPAFTGIAQDGFPAPETFGRLNPNLWEQTELPVYLSKRGKPLLINFGGLGPVLYGNKILTIHDISVLRNPEWFSKKYYYYYKLFTKISAERSVRIFTVSQFSKSEITGLLGIPSEKIDVIYNASPWEPEPAQFVSDKQKYILAVSSLEPRKNFTRLIKAFAQTGLKDYKLKIAGGISSVHRNEDFSSLPGNVELLGHTSDTELKELYRNASLFVYPSLYEGFGIPPLEAMAMGCPSLVSEAASLPEVCSDAALYVDPFDTESIAEGITTLLENSSKRNELVQKGFENVKRFSWRKSAEKVAGIIKDLQ